MLSSLLYGAEIWTYTSVPSKEAPWLYDEVFKIQNEHILKGPDQERRNAPLCRAYHHRWQLFLFRKTFVGQDTCKGWIRTVH